MTYVIGHKNPDTDSICSAIGYAALKNALNPDSAQPARAGDLVQTVAMMQNAVEIRIKKRKSRPFDRVKFLIQYKMKE